MKLLKGLLLSFAILLAGCSASTGSKLLGQPAPLTRFTMLHSGDAIASDSVKRPLVLAFWATSCKSSPKVVEKLNRYADKLADRGAAILAISIDKAESLETLKDVIQYRGLDKISHAFSGNDIYDEAYIAFQGSQIPYLVIVDESGNVGLVSSSVESVLDYFQIER